MTVEVMLGFFFPRWKPSFMRNCITTVCVRKYCIMREETERKKMKLQWVCCRLYPSICWIIIKEIPGNFYGGCSPH
jgi:hypothetical protein